MSVTVTPTPTPVLMPDDEFMLEEQSQKFQLWEVLVVAIAGILLINLIFIGIILLYKHCKRRKSIRFVYETKPNKSKKAGQPCLSLKVGVFHCRKKWFSWHYRVSCCLEA